MVTYNHESYIERAIHSVLNQKVNFPIKLFIGEDCSTDRTREICKNYSNKYPSQIKLFLHEKNIGANANGIFMYEQCFQSGAQYVALLEGDDFWTDENKLQKQVDFLDKNPDYSFCFHDAEVINDREEIISTSYLGAEGKKDMPSKDLIYSLRYVPTLTLCFRNTLGKIPSEMSKSQLGDMFILSLLGNQGKGKYQDEILPSVYRYHHGGVWSMTSDLNKKMMARSFYKQIGSYYGRMHQNDPAIFYREKLYEINPKILHDSIQEHNTKIVLKSAVWCFSNKTDKKVSLSSWVILKSVLKYFLTRNRIV